MRNRVANSPTPLNNSSISSTSRHQLKQKNMTDYFSQPRVTLSSIQFNFVFSQLIKKIKYLIAPTTTPSHIEQEWQNTQKGEQYRKNDDDIFSNQTLTEQLSNRYSIVKLLEVFQGLFILSFCWLVSVSLAFQIKIFVEYYYLMSFIIFIKIIGKIILACKDIQKENTYSIYWFEDFIQPTLLFGANLLMIIRYYFDFGWGNFLIIGYQIVCICLQIRGIGRYFEYLTLYAQQNKKRKELRIIELFCFTLAMAHLFALALYLMTHLCPQGSKTWIQKADLKGNPWYVLYVYSYYWANTTMVTVGYGDITPNNFVEAIIVTIIEVVGTAIFGYMINVIGLTVNEIQKKNLQFEEHQSTIYKMKDHYQLSRQLCHKMKNNIRKKQSQMKEIPLKNDEQKQFLEYIDPSLKEEFVLQTNMKVIKKSVFFLTHFTINFQNQIALRLIRSIYKPDEPLNLGIGDDAQMAFINAGKVNIYVQKSHHTADIVKLVRVIHPQQGKPTLNVFGYSAVIANRPTSLKAVTVETSTAYLLKRKDIIQCSSRSTLDFQSLNQLRQKMQHARRLEEIQAPSICDQQRHYIPNVFLLLKKIKYLSQQRRHCTRQKHRLRCSIITLKNYQDKTLLLIAPARKQEDISNSQCFIDLDELEEGNLKPKFEQKKRGKSIQLDQAKIFERFMKAFNVSMIASDYERSCLKKTYKKRTRAFSIKKSTKKL